VKKIFLSYRRGDSADMSGRIFDHLERRFGRERLFMDVDSIPLGDDFRRRIDEALDQSGVLLAVIGDQWLSATARSGTVRRLDDPDDYVAVEIAAALAKQIPVIPVLVGNARMPQPSELPAPLSAISYRNAAEVRSGRDFPMYVGRLIEAVEHLLSTPAPHKPSPARPSSASPPRLTFAMLEESPDRLVGGQLGAFVIDRVLAAGGSGIAYRARNPRTGQPVCVKVSLPVLSDMETIRRAVARGVRGIVSMNHPHVVRVHEFDGLELADGRSFYIVMDLVEGPLLNAWAASLPADQEGLGALLRISHLMARTLEAAHTCRYLDDAGFETVGVMHGDVKPGNVIVRADGTPALTDFMMVDIQRALDPEARDRYCSDNSTAVFGTPGFMAPEQYREGIVTVRTDIYSLGATLRAVSRQFATPELTALFDRMMGPSDERPRDMGEVARVLAAIARREGVESAEMRQEPPEPGRTPEPGGRGTAYPYVATGFRLRVLNGPHTGEIRVLDHARITVGRSQSNDFALSGESKMSRTHFGLNWSDERRAFVVADFQSRYGTTVNGEALGESRPLSPRDEIGIGDTRMVYERIDGIE